MIVIPTGVQIFCWIATMWSGRLRIATPMMFVFGFFLVFIVGAIGSVWFLRPIARRHLHMPAALRTGTAALEGTKAVVLQRVDVNGGRVRIGGEEWSARAYMEDQVLEPGTRVEVVKIEGATALVYE